MNRHELYEGICRGGPLDGQQTESRFPGGFILADKPGERVWIYDYDGTGQFTARDVQDLNYEKALKTATGDQYDVRAYDDRGA